MLCCHCFLLLIICFCTEMNVEGGTNYRAGKLSNTTSLNLSVKLSCVSCSEQHTLVECHQFKQKKQRDEMVFFERMKGCLCAGPISIDGAKYLIYGTCIQRHHMILYIDNRNTGGLTPLQNLVLKEICLLETSVVKQWRKKKKLPFR